MEKETILVFKTSVEKITDKYRIAPALDSMQAIKKWTVDLDDIDKVLRIECEKNVEENIYELMRAMGYHCELMY